MADESSASPALRRLKEVCRGYPSQTLASAIRLALAEDVAVDEEQAAIAALMAHWLTTEDGSPAPPVGDRIIFRVIRKLMATKH